MHLDTALVCALVGALAGWFVPLLIARIPEPEPAPEDEAPTALDEAAPEKTTYADLAAVPGLAWKTAAASALAAGVLGAALGWVWPLTFLVFLCPVGVALAYIDFRTWLLPTKVIHPSYLVVGALVLVGGLVTGDNDALLRAGIGLVVARSFFWLFWFLPHGLNLRGVVVTMVAEVGVLFFAASRTEWTRAQAAALFVAVMLLFACMLWFMPKGGMGFGDVRLAGLLGLALGCLGWTELLVGILGGFLLSSIGWVPLRLIGLTKSRNLPFGPFMLVAAVVGVLWPDLLELVGLAA